MGLILKPTKQGVELSVKAPPGSRTNEIRGSNDGSLKIAVTAIAEKGKAWVVVSQNDLNRAQKLLPANQRNPKKLLVDVFALIRLPGYNHVLVRDVAFSSR